MSSQYIHLLLTLIAYAVQVGATTDKAPMFTTPSSQTVQKTQLPPCKACNTFVGSFRKGLEATSRGKHEGGDAAWEEEKLSPYRKSEVRFTEIDDNLCTDTNVDEYHCRQFYEKNEQYIRDWFHKQQDDEVDIFKWLCIDKLEVCCSPNHYGPECKECTNCNGNGVCKGNGTRKGNGQCRCDAGYMGVECNACTDGYYESYRDVTKLLCSVCHKACNKDGCSGAGPKACYKCNDGWRSLDGGGCRDINECLETPRICRPNQFCVNDEGSHTCLQCDHACNGCNGDGPDMCLQCADGYTLKEGKCQDESNEQRENYVNMTRFLTYLGLCIATCVIFQSSTHIAFIVGAAVAIYIAASEYWLNTAPKAAARPEFDTKQLEDLIMKSL